MSTDPPTLADAPTLLRSEFPETGQPVRLFLIDGQPWFAAADVCKVLGRGDPYKVRAIVGDDETRMIDMREVTQTLGLGNHVPAGEKPRHRGNPLLNTISESGLYRLIMRSDKPAARPFQDWVTKELLPAIRQGEDVGEAHRVRMTESLGDAVGQRVRIVADLGHARGEGITVMSDGTVHCGHGEMEIRVPSREEDSGPPFGPYYQCPQIERCGIRGSRVGRPCGNVKFVDLVRRLAERQRPEGDGPVPEQRQQQRQRGDDVYLAVGAAQVHGSARQIAEVMREMGVVLTP